MTAEPKLAREARLATGLSLAKFADLIGVKCATLSGWEAGERTLTRSEQSYLRVILANPDGVWDLVKILRVSNDRPES